MTKMCGLLFAVLLSFIVVACGESTAKVDGKTAEQWKAEAVAVKAEANEAKEATRKAVAVSVLDALALRNSPCLKFALEESGRKQQQKACDLWASTFRKQAEAEASRDHKRRRAAYEEVWHVYPELMAQFAVLRYKVMFGGFDEKAQDQVNRLLERNRRFAETLKVAEHYRSSPADELKDKLYDLQHVHEAVGKYIVATGQEP